LATLQLILEGFDHVYIVLDALDECAERTKLLDLIEEIITWKLKGLHVLATSRRERVFLERLEPRASDSFDIQELIHEDIRIYIREKLRSRFINKKWLSKVQDAVENRLIENANGM